jgi:hypothetical protein
MPTRETNGLAESHLKLINDEIAKIEAMGPKTGSMGAEYLEHLYRQRDLWSRYLAQ